MKKIKTLQCIRCGKDHKLTDTKYNCTACGGNLQVLFDYNLIKKRLNYDVLKDNPERSIWRYLDILPVASIKNVPPVQVGWTPLYKAEKLGAEAGVNNLYIKDDGRNPSASFKDRASAVVDLEIDLRQVRKESQRSGSGMNSVSPGTWPKRPSRGPCATPASTPPAAWTTLTPPTLC